MTWISFMAGVVLGGITGVMIVTTLATSRQAPEEKREEIYPEDTDLGG
jgi:hypothetical protein